MRLMNGNGISGANLVVLGKESVVGYVDAWECVSKLSDDK